MSNKFECFRITSGTYSEIMQSDFKAEIFTYFFESFSRDTSSISELLTKV